MSTIRTAWAEKVGQPSEVVVDLQVEASKPGYIDSPCVVRGRVAVPDPPQTEDETALVAQALVAETVLPALEPDWQVRVLEMNTKRLRTFQRTVDVCREGLSMPRFRWWEKEYVENQYMRALPMRDVNHRLFDLFMNLQNVTGGGKIGLRRTANGVEWWRFVQHVLTEVRSRELPYPLFIDKRHAPDWANDAFVGSVTGNHAARAERAIREWKKTRRRDYQVVKYGEYQFMRAFLDSGQVQISPSRTFKDEQYVRALRDDENSMSAFGARGLDGYVIPAGHLPDWWGDRYAMRQFTTSMDRDYLLYCMTATLSPTLFSHFGEGYDACVLVHDVEALARRLDEATKESFPAADFVHAFSPVVYVDPLGAIPASPGLPDDAQVPIPFLKHFRYAYQDEVRFVWVPREPRRSFRRTSVSIGSLEDIAEIIRV